MHYYFNYNKHAKIKTTEAQKCKTYMYIYFEFKTFV